MACDYLYMPGLKLIHVSKMRYRYYLVIYLTTNKAITDSAPFVPHHRDTGHKLYTTIYIYIYIYMDEIYIFVKRWCHQSNKNGTIFAAMLPQ